MTQTKRKRAAKRRQSQQPMRLISRKTTTTTRPSKHLILQRTRSPPSLQHRPRSNPTNVPGAPTFLPFHIAIRVHRRRPKLRRSLAQKRRRSRTRLTRRHGHHTYLLVKASQAMSRMCKSQTRNLQSAHSSPVTTAIQTRATQSNYTISRRRQSELAPLLVSLSLHFLPHLLITAGRTMKR
jgi:hypothetical protein